VTEKDPKAPHGREVDGTPKAPYGLKTDGTPRLSRRGAQAGQRGNNSSSRSNVRSIKGGRNTTDQQRKAMLVELTQNFVAMPLVALSSSPVVQKKIGASQADALAGDALILDQFAAPLADGLIMLSQAKPGVLSWMDTVEEKAPYLQLMMVGIQMTKALVGNHLRPDPRLAEAGRTQMQLKAQAMAAEVERQAREAGVHPDQMAEAA